MGYAPGEDASHIIWDEKTHGGLYDTVGLVANSDRCRILRRYTHARNSNCKGTCAERRARCAPGWLCSNNR